MPAHPLPSRFPASAPDLLEFLGRRVADQQLHCVLGFTDRIDADRLAAAVRLSLDAEPVLGCRFVAQAWRSCWERRGDLNRVSLLQVTEGGDLAAGLQQFMVQPSDPALDPLVQVRVFRSASDTVCVKINHVVSDAAGLMDYVGLVAALYLRLASEPSYRPAANLGERGFRQVLRHFPASEKWGALRKRAALGVPRALPQQGTGTGGRAILLRAVSAERVQALRSYRLALHATLNDVLLTAFVRALSRECSPSGPGPLLVQVAVDLRRLLPQARAAAVCNLAGAVFLALDMHDGESFEATLAQVVSSMRSLEAGSPGLAGAVFVEAFSKLGLGLGTCVLGALRRAGGGIAQPPIYSNLGVLGARLDFGPVKVRDAYLVGPVMFPGSFLLALSSFGGALTVTAGVCDEGTPRASIERLLDTFLKEWPS